MKKTISALVALLGPLFLIIVLAHISYTIEGYTSVSFNPYPRMIWYLASGVLVALYLAVLLVLCPRHSLCRLGCDFGIVTVCAGNILLRRCHGLSPLQRLLSHPIGRTYCTPPDWCDGDGQHPVCCPCLPRGRGSGETVKRLTPIHSIHTDYKRRF